MFSKTRSTTSCLRAYYIKFPTQAYIYSFRVFSERWKEGGGHVFQIGHVFVFGLMLGRTHFIPRDPANSAFEFLTPGERGGLRVLFSTAHVMTCGSKGTKGDCLRVLGLWLKARSNMEDVEG